MAVSEARVQRWSAAIREVEVLEPWLTESHWDAHYWDDVALLIANDPRSERGSGEARAALEDALRQTFPAAPIASDNGFYRDHVDERLELIVSTAMTAPEVQ